MNRVFVLMAAVLGMTGCASCGGTPDQPAISLDDANDHIRQGRLAAGLIRYAEIWKELESRTDWAASLTRGRILLRCTEFDAVQLRKRLSGDELAATEPLALPLSDEPVLHSMAAEQWMLVLHWNSDQPSQLEAAAAMARIVDRKLTRPELNRMGLPDDDPAIARVLHRRLMLECMADYERYYLGRSALKGRDTSKLCNALNLLAAENVAVAALPGIKKEVARLLNDRAREFGAEANQAMNNPEKFTVKPAVYDFVEADPKKLVDDAGRFAEEATSLMARGDPGPVVTAIGAALRRYLFVIESTSPENQHASNSRAAIAFWYPKFVDWARAK